MCLPGLFAACPYRRVNSSDGVPRGELNESLLICGAASDGLDLLPDRSIRTAVTSPPYWSLRDYEMKGPNRPRRCVGRLHQEHRGDL